MSDSLGFLRQLKPQTHRSKGASDFLFELNSSGAEPSIRTVAAHDLSPVRVNPDNYSGAPGRLLSFLESVSSYPFESDTPFYLYSEPLAALRLSECANVVTPRSRQPLLPPDAATASVVLHIAPKEDDDSTLVPHLRLRYKDGRVTDDFFLLSDVLACDFKSFVFIHALGDNFDQTAIFCHEFPASMLADYLAVTLTFLPEIRIEIPGRTLRYGEPVECHRTIVIEKMDTDHALYLSVRSLPPGDVEGELQSIETTVLVRDNENGSLTAYPLRSEDNEMLTRELYEIICNFAPNKTERSYVYCDGKIIIVPELTASEFLLRGLPALLKDYKITGLDRIKDFKLRYVTPKLNVNLRSGINFLEGTVDINIEGQIFSILDILKQYKSSKFITLTDGSRAVLDEKFVRRIERVFGSKINDETYRLSFFDLPEIEQYIENRDRNAKALKKSREFYAGFNDLAGKRLKLPRIKATLRKYQEDGVKWLNYLYANGMGGCLADDMGLGKTLQVISLIDSHIDDKDRVGPTLVVMPRSLLFNWESEFRKFAPHIDVALYHGHARDMDEALSHTVILTTYAMVRNDIQKFRDIRFEAIILDESQTIKNPDTHQSKAIALLNSPHRFALSGTPIENNLAELFAQFRFINPGMFGSFDDFQSRYLVPIQRDHDTDALKSLRSRIFPFMLRRLKRDVLDDLPDRIDKTIYVDMSDEHAAFYESHRRKILEQMEATIAKEGLNKAKFMILQAIGELRRIASVPESMTEGQIASPKLDMLVEQISQAVENGHKVLVFFNFIAGLELLAERLNGIGISTETMTGATRDRQSIVDSFQNSDDLKVLVMTLKTGGVGLNLTAADMVFIVEPWWNLAAQEQAINRLHRIGQKSTVFSYSLITRNSIEEKIEQLQKMKSDLFQDVIISDESTAKLLSEDDINFILS